MKLPRLLSAHPASVGETYVEHLRSASAFALRMMLGGLACLVHSVLPFIFVSTGSRCVGELYERMVVRRDRPRSATGMQDCGIRPGK